MLLLALVGLATSDKSGVTRSMLWLLVTGCPLVGFCEEVPLAAR